MARGRAQIALDASAALKCRLEEVPVRIANLQSELREANQKLKAALTGGSSDAISSAIENAVDCGSYKLVVAQLEGLEAADLRNVWDTVRQKGGSAVACVIATVTSKGQPALLAAATDEAVAAGAIGDVIEDCPMVGGGGGGRPQIKLQAGGKDASGIPAALQPLAKNIYRVTNMVVLALDIGETRIGIAASDRSGRVAMPLRSCECGRGHQPRPSFRMLAQLRAPGFGLRTPQTMAGEEGPQAERIKGVAQKLSDATGLPVAFADERLSSREAKRILREEGLSERQMRGKVDMIAASLFLQAWLDGHDRKESRGWRPSATSEALTAPSLHRAPRESALNPGPPWHLELSVPLRPRRPVGQPCAPSPFAPLEMIPVEARLAPRDLRTTRPDADPRRLSSLSRSLPLSPPLPACFCSWFPRYPTSSRPLPRLFLLDRRCR